MGVEGARQVLQAGANDLGGTLMDENISRAAGAQHGQRMGVEELRGSGGSAGPPARAAIHPVRHGRGWRRSWRRSGDGGAVTAVP